MFNKLLEKQQILDYVQTLRELSQKNQLFADHDTKRVKTLKCLASIYEVSADHHYPQLAEGETELIRQRLKCTAGSLGITLTKEQLNGSAPLPLIGLDTVKPLKDERIKWQSLDNAVFFIKVLSFMTLS